MKRIVAFVIFMCLVSVIAGCGAKPHENVLMDENIEKAVEAATEVITLLYSPKDEAELLKNNEKIKNLVSQDLYTSRFDINDEEIFYIYYYSFEGANLKLNIIDTVAEVDKETGIVKVAIIYSVVYTYPTDIENVVYTGILKYNTGKIISFDEYS